MDSLSHELASSWIYKTLPRHAVKTSRLLNRYRLVLLLSSALAIVFVTSLCQPVASVNQSWTTASLVLAASATLASVGVLVKHYRLPAACFVMAFAFSLALENAAALLSAGSFEQIQRALQPYEGHLRVTSASPTQLFTQESLSAIKQQLPAESRVFLVNEEDGLAQSNRGIQPVRIIGLDFFSDSLPPVLDSLPPTSLEALQITQRNFDPATKDLLNQPPTPLRPVIVDQEFAERLDLSAGDDFRLISPTPKLSPSGLRPSFTRLTVQTVLRGQFGQPPHIFVPQSWLKQFISRKSPAESLEIWLPQKSSLFGQTPTKTQLQKTQETLRNWFQRNLQSAQKRWVVENWHERYPTASGALDASKWGLAAGLALLLLSTIFGVLTFSSVVLRERKSNLAILQACGASPTLLRRSILNMSAILSIDALHLCAWLLVLFSGSIRLWSPTLEADELLISTLFLKLEPLQLLFLCILSLLCVFLSSLAAANNSTRNLLRNLRRL